ncbi:iron ABC transporter permease [Rhodobacterales bacterium HKCCE2091]|nr:iron ABC transporter permease [Rhodobacterales bacterium HKCCE2091]
MNARVLLLALLLPSAALAQGFAGLGTDAEGYALPDPDHRFDFPEDHGPHPDFRIEWWYLTAVLDGDDGATYGVQWTLFRAALSPEEATGWGAEQIWMGHAGLTTPDGHFTAERLARGGIGQAGATADPFEAWIDDWAMTGRGGTPDALDAIRLTARGMEFAYDFSAEATGPIVAHGANGYSVKSQDGQASHYYSQPFYEMAGTLTLPAGEVAVTGTGWLDREWSSQPLGPDQTGWDWFSLGFDDGSRMMAFRLRSDTGRDYTTGTWIDADGSAETIPAGALTLAPGRTARVAGRDIPVEWTVTLPARGLDLAVTAMTDDAWMDTSFPYWEGPVTVTGSHEGRGFLEMTGY